MLASKKKYLFLTLFYCVCIKLVFATNWYVDPSSIGSNSGTLANPWKTLSAINWAVINPGDNLNFKRGEKFTGQLSVNKSGTSGNPITLSAYGTGEKPMFWGTGSQIASVFNIFNRSYLVFDNLLIIDTTISAVDKTIQAKIQRGFVIDQCNHITIQNVAIERVGVGIYTTSDFTTIDSCNIGNLRMVVNTFDGPPPGNDDDYGANPIVVSASDCVISHNYFHDCWAYSYDYGVDGGAIDIYSDIPLIKRVTIAYNTLIDCNGVMEIGGTGGNTVDSVLLYYNTCVKNGSAIYVSNTGNFQTTVTHLYVENNVFVEDYEYLNVSDAMIAFKTAPTLSSTLFLRNNIFHIYGTLNVCRSQWSASGALTTASNVFRLGSGSSVNYTLGTKDTVVSTSTLIWLSETGDQTNWDFHLRANSPAIERGQNLGYLTDQNNTSISGFPESGVFEYITSVPILPGNKKTLYRFRIIKAAQ